MKISYCIFIFVGLFFQKITICAQTAISGKVIDVDFREELIWAKVELFKKGVLIRSDSTDIDGNYKMNVDPGIYDICLLYTSPSPRDQRGSRMPSSA